MMTQLLPALLAAGTPAPDPAIAEVIARASLAHEALMAGDIRTFRDAMALAPDFVLMDGPLPRSTARSAPLDDHTGTTLSVMPVSPDLSRPASGR